LRSYNDITTKTLLNVEIQEGTVLMEVEGKGNSMEVLLDSADAVAVAVYICTKALSTVEEIDEFCSFLKERVGKE
jgi:hypothetical protein